jgi:nicotinate dehydrogenase subunit B
VKTNASHDAATLGVLTQNRRDFLRLLGGGILVGIYSPESAQAQDKLPNAYLAIGAEGTVTIYTGKVEMGQGVMTSLAQMAAEELDVPLQSMRAVMGDTASCPVDSDGGTWGSLTTRNFGPALRSAAARGRAILVQLASAQLGVPADQLITQAGYVVSRTDENVRVSYASLAGGKMIDIHLQTTPNQKSFAQFTVSGKPALRQDAVEKVTGKAKYAADSQVPGMLYARILRPPAHGAKLKPGSVDTSEAEKVPGAIIVSTGSLLAVLHEQPDMAGQALALIKAEYDLPQAGPDDETIYQYLLSRAPAGQVFEQKGNLAAGEQLATAKLEQTYYTPYVAHAPIEPHAAVASIEGGQVTVWASTQTPFGLRSQVGGRVIAPYVGGGFGGKVSYHQAVEAVQLARAAGKPVNLTWTREEEFFYDTFQPASVIKLRSGLDQNNKICFWDCRVYFAGNRGASLLYDIPNFRTQIFGNYGDGAHPFEMGPWRAPGNNTNTFARESHINILAAAAGVDALAFRLMHLKNARMRKVLETAAQSFGWQPAKPPSGRGYGVACGEDAGAYVAMMAELEVDRTTGGIKVKRLLCAQDVGQVINPDGARMQMEGSMMMGMGYALSEEIHFQYGRIHDLNFDRYGLPRFSWMPKLETVLVENNTLAPQGGGEPPIITTGAVLANAVFDAIGVGLNRLPMTPARVLAAIQASSTLLLDPPIRSGDQIQLSWNGGPGIKLQRSSSLANPVWQDVPDTDAKNSVNLPLTEATAFFRVFKP